jgi:hypothetical protein
MRVDPMKSLRSSCSGPHDRSEILAFCLIQPVAFKMGFAQWSPGSTLTEDLSLHDLKTRKQAGTQVKSPPAIREMHGASRVNEEWKLHPQKVLRDSPS